MTREVVLAARPQGAPQESDFLCREFDERDPGEGEVLVRNVFVSVDPYMRSRMSGIRTYVGPYEVGESIDGGAVGRVVASNDTGFAEGDWVLSGLGWRERGIAQAAHLRKLDPDAGAAVDRARRRSACPGSPRGSGSSTSARCAKARRCTSRVRRARSGARRRRSES